MNIKSAILDGMLLLSTSFVFAQSTDASTTTTTASTIAVVDMHVLLEKSPQMEKMRTDLEKQFATEHDSIAKAQQTLQTKAKKVEADSAVMTKADLTKAKETLVTAQKALQERQVKFQQAVYTAQDKAMQTILDKITAIVTTIAKANHYDLVVPKNSTIYATKGSDITATVKAQLLK